MDSIHRRWTHLTPADSNSLPNTTNPSLHPYQSPNDERTSSTASLLPAPGAVEAIQSGQSSLRTLLCVFIHGFVGDETSFRSFPAHFHELLTILVQDTHVVHTKVYPKFKTRDKISLAVDNFSKWLSQFESQTTDVILLGHSMGGLVAADVALLQPLPPGRHRILGTISFDTPFIGIHPGVVKSGLASLFVTAEKPADDPDIPDNLYDSPRPGYDHDDTSSILSGSSNSSSASVSTFTPPVIKPRKSAWQSGLSFLRKHQGDLKKATLAYVNGHLEFSGALLDFNVMKKRYFLIKALERADIEDRRRGLCGDGTKALVKGGYVPRVRFVNYYTVSTGRPKREKSREREEKSRGFAEDGSYRVVMSDGRVISVAIPPVAATPTSTEMPTPETAESNPDSSEVKGDGYEAPPAYSVSSDSPLPTTDKKEEATEQKKTAPPLPPRSRSGTPTPKDPAAQKKAEYADLRKKEKTFCITPREEDPCWVKVKLENVDEVGAHCGLFFVNGVPGVTTPPAANLPEEDPLSFNRYCEPGIGKDEMPGFEGGVYERLLGDVTQRIEGWCSEWMSELAVSPEIVEVFSGL
ncbi:hypothetical protein TWF694_007737 [Orbilia ellipsospora]|uniref:DUF676 domain-containing protein n=1 Tax=Orbilia ellipsospora TaxID=2528407 RepID=A0AAV9XL74_9PEZI